MKTTNTQNLIAAAITCALASTATAVQAADTGAVSTSTSMTSQATEPTLAPAADPDAWKFGVTVPLWAPGINGTVTARGHQENANVNFAELKDHLDASASLALNVQKGKFGIFGNVGYMKFSADTLGPLGDVRASMGLKFVVANGGVSYLLVRTESEHPFILAGTAGVRYWYTDTSIRLTEPKNSGNTLFSGGNAMDLAQPVIGVRATQYLTSKLHLDIAGDGGGFNVNNSTDWTWSTSGLLSYDFTKWFTLSAGYQALAIDESKGGGTSQKGVNLVFQGVEAALTFKF